MVITTNTTLSVRSEIREALKSFNSNPFASAGLYEDALNAEDAILIQISDQTKKVTLEDLGGYLNIDASGANPTVANVLPLLLDTHFVQTSSKIALKNFDTEGKLDFAKLTDAQTTTVADVDSEENIDEPTTDPSVSPTTITDTDYKYLTFPYVVPDVVYDTEKLYPSLRRFEANITTVEGQSYGNGEYVVDQSSAQYANSQGFAAFDDFNYNGPTFETGNYTNGTYNSTEYIKDDYLGEWITIQMPVAIQLTKIGISIQFTSSQPTDFKIYGSNDGTNWDELHHDTDATYVSAELETTLTTNVTYNHFALVVNKVESDDTCILNFWYIYGKEVLAPDPTAYTINFPENTTVQVLLLDDASYIETEQFVITGGSANIDISVGNPSVFDTTTTSTNSTVYESGYASSITGESLTYNAKTVIVRYKFTKILTTQVTTVTPLIGFFNFNGRMGGIYRSLKIQSPHLRTSWLSLAKRSFRRLMT